MRKKDKERDLRKLYYSTGKYPKKHKEDRDDLKWGIPKEYIKLCRWFDKVIVMRYRSKLRNDLKKIDIDNLEEDNNLSARKDLYEKADWYW